ncbi:DNA repair protein RecN [Flavobacterium noncentrifugens]|uniref:DNA repair protein RecN n=1 Tax=Flavobacterium noncentrifugens TaxID=1128970 RepID=A0A1G8WCF3_9FLAO|nr:DNA repair protein RecN [Flavobacterium noncentrifugens]GEP50863.1 DNA repair protein RecN [Flavobacterium noncentrifugens]SDJ75904.1 DNA repair protein RecN (Recombination protein N) [Flavobacterium noncentrifugens]
MITSLSISNFALIEKLGIDFSEGFSIITGETGAGKSILLGALGLIMGKRADLSSLKNKEEKCVVEAHFNIAAYDLKSFFEANDLDYESDTIIRREILPSGKSRAFINDTPVNLAELQDLSAYLIDIHSQHQTQELSEDDFQFRIIDAVGSNQAFLSNYSKLLKAYKKDKSALANLNESLKAILKEQDYNAFLLEELLAAQLKSEDQTELESLFEQLNNVEFIKENLYKSLAVASEEQFGVIQNLKEIKTALQKISGFSKEYQSIFERLNSVAIEFDDISDEINKFSENLVHDPQQLELVNQKLQMIYNLQKKHQVSTVSELLEIQNDLDNKALSASTLETDIKKLEESLAKTASDLDAIAVSIYKNRETAIPVLTKKWAEILLLLGMPNVRFKIEVSPTESYLNNGKDELQFLFSANAGSDFGLLKKVASGGEMSRIMLATKAILAQYSKLPTIIFDEIDTGVSGEIADKMGEIMKDMSLQMQVLAITHLPQIAAKGNDHFKVFKTTADNQTTTALKLLSKDERITEIAQMLSGSAVSDSAINHAKALLN